MNFAIDFDNQTARMAIKINDVRVDRMLPSKFEPSCLLHNFDHRSFSASVSSP